MTTLYNRARVTTATVGTGTMTLGAAVSAAFFTFAEAGVPDAAVVSYVIEDGTDVEMGIGTYTSAGTTLSRDTVTASKISGTAGTTKLTLSGSAVVFIDALAADIVVAPASSTNNAIARFNGTTGRAIQGDADLTWLAGAGETNKQHSAIGGRGVIDTPVVFAGGTDEFTFDADSVLTISEELVVDGSRRGAGLSLYPTYEASANVDASHPLIGADFGPTVNDASIGDIATLTALGFYCANQGAGDITTMQGGSGGLEHYGAGVVTTALGFSAYGYGDPTSGGIVNFKAFYAEGFGGGITNAYGLDIADFTGVGSGVSYNLRSQGATSLNIFEGIIGLGTAAPDRKLHVEEETAATNTVTELLRLTSTSSGSPAAGIGAGIEFEVETAAANNEVGAIVEAYVKDATSTSEDFGWRIKTMTAGQAAATSLDISLPGTAYPQGHIFGLTMSNAADTANDITVAAGEAVDETGVWNMTLAAAITKRIDGSNWVVGDNQDGLNTGNEAAGWYEVILIGREDTRVVDVMFSTTANRATLPASYTHKRRIGWVKRNPGNTSFEQFIQIDDHFTLITQINDASITATATAAAITVTVPPNCIGRFRIASDSNTDNAVNQVTVFSEIVEGNVAPTDATGIASIGCHDIAGSQASHMELRVSATSTIEHDSSHTANVVDVSTFGWIDSRRRVSAI
jgi:hypothetical protein